MLSVFADLRYALRQLRRAPGFALAAAGTLALAIGATTALVSVLRATLLNPTPFPHIGRVVSLQDTTRNDANFDGITNVPRAVALDELRTSDGGRVFDALGFFYADSLALSLQGEPPSSTPYIAVSGAFFRVLEAKPLLGRTLTPADDAPGAPETAVLGYGLWRRLFAGSPGAVGRTVSLNGKPATVVGVMPKEFAYPTGIELWKPAHIPMLTQSYRGTSSRYLNVVARMSEAVTLDQARQAVDLLAARLARAYPATDAEWGFRVQPLRAVILGEYRQALFLLAAAVAMLLLIACANVAGLQLARNAAREPEIAIRRMLGVGGARLLRQLLTESLVLFAAGGSLGVLLAAGLLQAFVAALPAALLAFAEPRLDRGTLLAMLGLTLLTGLACGAAPALQFGIRAPRQGRTVIASTRRFGWLFASAQTALALVLLALASVLLGRLYRLAHAPLGFESARVLAVSAHLPFGTEPAVHRFYRQLEERFATIPGVDAVGAINALPFNAFSAPRRADIVGRPPTPHGDSIIAEGRKFTPSYTAAMRIPLLAGRGFTLQDGEPNAPVVVLINQAFQRT